MFLKGAKGLAKKKETIKDDKRPVPEWAEGRVDYIKKKCIKCQLCVKYCPAVAIKPTKDKYIEVDHDVCISCAVCTEVCPTKALVMRSE